MAGESVTSMSLSEVREFLEEKHPVQECLDAVDTALGLVLAVAGTAVGAATGPENGLLFWHAIRTACEQGYRWFDFGRTDIGHEGLRNFKLSWGAVEEPIFYETLGAETPPPPAADGSEGMATRVLGTVIRHSPPLVCRAVGEALYRYVA